MYAGFPTRLETDMRKRYLTDICKGAWGRRDHGCLQGFHFRAGALVVAVVVDIVAAPAWTLQLPVAGPSTLQVTKPGWPSCGCALRTLLVASTWWVGVCSGWVVGCLCALPPPLSLLLLTVRRVSGGSIGLTCHRCSWGPLSSAPSSRRCTLGVPCAAALHTHANTHTPSKASWGACECLSALPSAALSLPLWLCSVGWVSAGLTTGSPGRSTRSWEPRHWLPVHSCPCPTSCYFSLLLSRLCGVGQCMKVSANCRGNKQQARIRCEIGLKENGGWQRSCGLAMIPCPTPHLLLSCGPHLPASPENLYRVLHRVSAVGGGVTTPTPRVHHE
jgi:hypothetical protein